MSQGTIIRYKGLELLCNPDTITLYRDGKLGLDKVVQTEEVFSSVSKGNRAKDSDLQSAFGSTNVRECIDVILQKGAYQVSAAERKARHEAKRREIIGYITKNYLDARNKLPIPPARVEAAIDQLKIRIDADASTDKQIAQILKKLPSILPLTKQKGMTGILRVPHKFVGSAQNIVRKYGTIDSERYEAAGAIYEVTVSGGDSVAFLNAMTKLAGDAFTFDIAS